MRPGIATAGQPTRAGLARLAALGFKTVITLRADDEDPLVAEERILVEKAGLRYVQVPVAPATFSLADVEAVRAALDAAGAQPALLHCSTANRVGAVWMVMEVRRGSAPAVAEREAELIGLKSAPMREAARRLAGLEATR
jgi:uncharacterized protein (TIGR01244 family)